MKQNGSDGRPTVAEKFDGRKQEGRDGISSTEPQTVIPQKTKLLSEQEPERLAHLRETWAQSGDNNPYKAIRNFCMDCLGGSTKLVAECESGGCPLWKFRFGCKPLPQGC